MKLSPMMEQYMAIKKRYKDCILFFRLGDFYEMFFEDAELVSRLLELTLTGKSCGLEERAPMCGVPFHAADSYIEKLVNMGYKVAIGEQLEDPAKTKGMVRRDVVKIVTPGTLTSNSMLKENENNYLASVYMTSAGMGIAYCDISTGEFYVTEKTGGDNLYEDVINELVKINAREVLINEEFALSHDVKEVENLTDSFVHEISPAYYSGETAKTAIQTLFGEMSLTSLGLSGRDFCVMATGAILAYLLETQMQALKQITDCRFYEIGNHMSLDKASIRNLEITETLYDKKDKRESALGLGQDGHSHGRKEIKTLAARTSK